MLIELKDCFNDNGTFVPKNDNNSEYQNILERISNGEQYQAYDPLPEAKESKKQTLKANRDNALNNSIYSISVNGEGCDFYLRTFDLAAIQGRINNLPNNTETMSWGCTDGRRVQLNKTAFESLQSRINQNDETVYNLYADKMQEIEDAQTLEELENININFS